MARARRAVEGAAGQRTDITSLRPRKRLFLDTLKVSVLPCGDGARMLFPLPATGNGIVTKIASRLPARVPQDFTYESLTLHWNGTAWVEIESPNTTEYNWFNGVTAPASNDVWALGYEYEDGGNAIAHPLIQHWNGTDWSVVDNPQVPDGHYTNLADAAWISSTDVVAVGTSTDAHDNYDPLIEQWDGSAWTLAAVPEIRGMPTTFVLAVAADKAGGYWAVGWAQKPSPLTFKNYIVRRSP